MTRVIHLLSSNKFSGAENVVCQIIRMFNDLDYEMFYCSPAGSISQSLKERNVKYVAINKLSVSEVRRVISEIKPDIIHAHDMKAGVIASLSCGRIPMVSHIHNNNFDSQRITFKSILYKYAAEKANHIIWVSKSSFEGYRFHHGLEGKSTILYNVIDIDQLVAKAEMADLKNVYDIIYIGRITEQKNPERLVKVIGRVVNNNRNIKAAIIGQGELEGKIRQIISGNNLQNNIEYLGFQSNPYGMLKNAKLMLMTSRWEGTPMCALEAMALGIPIVSTPTDGLIELIENGETGYLCNSDKELVEACTKIVNNSVLHDKLSRKSLIRARGIMDINRYRNTLHNIYKSCEK